MTIYCFGHGDWQVKNSATPWAKVPRGMTLYFYTENNETLRVASASMIAIERGESPTFAPSGNDILGEPNGQHGEYSTVPNYTLSPATPEMCQIIEYVVGSGNAIFVDQPTPLCTGVDSDGSACIESDRPFHTCEGVFANPRVQDQDVVWLACRALGLDDMGGSTVGVNRLGNEGEGSTGEWGQFIEDVWAKFQEMGSDEFWSYFQSLDQEAQIAVLTWDEVRQRFDQEGRF